MKAPTSDLDRRTRTIKEFFDGDAARYLHDRYPAEAQTCDQFSYLVRRRYVLQMLDRAASKGRLLDIGCGPAVLTPELVRRGWHVSAVDLSTGMLESARRAARDLPAGTAHFVAAQATRLPFRDASFEAVLCVGVVSYVNDVPALLRDVRRVLRPGGDAILQISNALGLFEIEGRVLDLVRKIAPQRARDSHDRFRAEVRLHAYRPAAFDTWCREAGLERREFRFFDFRPPQTLEWVTPRLSLGAGKHLERLGASRASIPLAASYLVRVGR